MDKRLDLLNYLITQKRIVPSRELQTALNISRRTVTNYVNEINSMEHNTILSTNQGYRCADSPASRKVRQELQNVQSFDSYEKRRSFLFQEVLLKSSHPALEDLADKMFISPATLNNELGRLRTDLKGHGLYLKTKNNQLYIIGSERNIRRFIMLLLNQELKQSHFDIQTIQRFFNHADIIEIDGIIKEILQKNSCFLDDFSLLNYVLHLAVCIESAFSMPKSPEQTHAALEHASLEHAALLKPVESIVEEIYLRLKEIYPVAVSFEQVLDASVLMATRIVAVNINELDFKQSESRIPPGIKELLFDIIISVQEIYGIDLKKDNFMVRFAFHLKHLLDRATHKIEIPENSFITVKNDYPFLYVIAEFIASIINRRYDIQLPDIETAYISLHLGILMEETRSVYHKVNCILVIYDYYKMGLSIMENIKKRTDALYFADIVTSYEQIKNNENIDLILTTLPGGHNTGIPEIQIHALPTPQDYERILSKVNELMQKLDTKEFTQKLRLLFKNELFFPDARFSAREKCIDFLCGEMEKHGFADSGFRDEIYYHEKIASSAYRNVALPHSLAGDRDSLQPSAIAVAICKDAFPWGTGRVNFVFLLSLRNVDRHLFKDLFSVLSAFLSSDENCERLKNCTDFESFIKLLASEL